MPRRSNAAAAALEASAEPVVVIETSKTPKEPPPEDASQIQKRRLVIVSFWLLALIIGLPTWWKTTTVYRASLPLQRMSEWADGKVCSPVYPLRVSLLAPSLHRTEAQHLQQSAQHALDDSNDFSAHHLRVSLPHGIANPDDAGVPSKSEVSESPKDAYSDLLAGGTALTVKLNQVKTAVAPEATLHLHTNELSINYNPSMLPSSASSPSVLGTFIASELQHLFAEEQALLASLHGARSKHLTPERTLVLAKRTTRSLKYAPTYHLTFSLFTPEASPSSWDIEQALHTTFGPLLTALSPMSNFTIDTQVQSYAKLPPSIQPIYDDQQKAWTLNEKDLGGFINTAEWPLSPSIGIGPTINFLLYVPSPATSPLVISGTSSNTWLIPQWGSVALFDTASNLKGGRSTHLDASSLQPTLLGFSSQLMSLLGVPTQPDRSLPMRLSTLTRVRAASLFVSASSTLGSLARLVSSLPTISIPDSVADNVASTMRHLDAACSNFKEGAFNLALQNAKAAEAHAEKAFFEKSMVGQVYFPDEHKVAVYLPLLGPVAVPLVVAALREIRALLQRRRKSKTG